MNKFQLRYAIMVSYFCMMRCILINLLIIVALVPAQAQTFTVIDSLPVGAYGTAAWGDYDGDGRKDLVYITQTVTVGQPDIFTVYHNTPSGFVAVTQSFTHLFTPAACWGDLNNDGKEDLVVSGMHNSTLENLTQIYQSNGNGTFMLKDTLVGLSIGSIDIGDYDNDGLKDIAACGVNSVGLPLTYIYHNDGNFSFSDINAGLQGVNAGELKWCDYDNDGKMDIALNGYGVLSSRTWIYHNNGGNNFTLVSPYMKGGAGTVDWFDYDGDGLKDLLTAGVDSSGAHNFTDLYKNTGNNTFTLQTSFNAPKFGEPVATDVADFDGDGKLDICFGGGNDSFFNFSSLALGSGSPLFNFTAFNKVDIQNCIAAAADIDNDGDEDLLLSNFILRNDGVTTSQILNSANLVIYPNPTSDKIVIENLPVRTEIKIVTVQGTTIYNSTSVNKKHIINVASYAKGNYFLLLMNEGQITVKKVVIQH